MKILAGFSYSRYPGYDVKSRTEAWAYRLREAGFDVDLFCLTLDPPGDSLIWHELDARWRRGDKKLLSMYKDLAIKLKEYDVFVNLTGINLHPKFVEKLDVFTVFGCFDDPESSELLSKPVAAAYDLCMVGNIAEVENYLSWGAKHAYYWPIGFRREEYDPNLTKDQIFYGKRDIDISLVCDYSTYRKERLDKFSLAFPNGAYYGNRWPNGFLPEENKIPLYQNSKIGINFHLSTGPINFRTFVLPANGVMQICDNKKNLGKIFKLNKEAVGFDTVEEAIELCQYYLDNDHERKEIAVAGWERVTRDYNEIKVFNLMVDSATKLYKNKKKNKENVLDYLKSKKIDRYSELNEFLEYLNKDIQRTNRRVKNQLRKLSKINSNK